MTSPTDTLDLGDGAGHLGQHRDLHLHRLQQHQGVALADLIALAEPRPRAHWPRSPRERPRPSSPHSSGCCLRSSNHTTGLSAVHSRAMRECMRCTRHATLRGRAIPRTDGGRSWPSVAARSATASTRRPTTASGPTRLEVGALTAGHIQALPRTCRSTRRCGDVSQPRRMIVVRLISMRSRSTQALGGPLAAALAWRSGPSPAPRRRSGAGTWGTRRGDARSLSRVSAVHSPSSNVHTSAITAAHSGWSGSTGPTGGAPR